MASIEDGGTYEELVERFQQYIDDIDKVVIPLMPCLTLVDPHGACIEHHGIGGIILRCSNDELLIKHDLMSRFLNECFFQKHRIPIVLSIDLHELNPANR